MLDCWNLDTTKKGSSKKEGLPRGMSHDAVFAVAEAPVSVDTLVIPASFVPGDRRRAPERQSSVNRRTLPSLGRRDRSPGHLDRSTPKNGGASSHPTRKCQPRIRRLVWTWCLASWGIRSRGARDSAPMDRTAFAHHSMHLSPPWLTALAWRHRLTKHSRCVCSEGPYVACQQENL